MGARVLRGGTGKGGVGVMGWVESVVGVRW